MEKTELMKRYEKETGIKSMRMVKNGTLILPTMTIKASQQFFPSSEYIEWLESKVMSSHKAKPLEWSKGAGNSINADCPRGQFCIYFDDGYSYQLFDEDDYPITDAEGAYSLAEAKQLCQEWLQDMVDKAMGFVEV